MSNSNKFQLMSILFALFVMACIVLMSSYTNDKYVVTYTILAYDKEAGEWYDFYPNQHATVRASDYMDMRYEIYDLEQSNSPQVVIDSIRVDSFVIVK